MAGRLDYGAPFFTPDLGFMHPLRQSVSFCAVLYKLFYFFLIRDFYTKRHKTAHFRESARPPANGLAMLVQAAPSPPGVASAGRLGKPALWNGTRGGTGGAWHGCWRRGSRALAVAMLIPLGSVAVMAPQQKKPGGGIPGTPKHPFSDAGIPRCRASQKEEEHAENHAYSERGHKNLAAACFFGCQ